MFIFKKNQILFDRLEDYLKVNQETIDQFVEAMEYMMKKISKRDMRRKMIIDKF